MTCRTDEEDWEHRQAARDEYLADLDYERRKREHEAELCETDKCKFCAREWAEAIKENQGG